MLYINKILYLLSDRKKQVPSLIILFLSSSVFDIAGIGLIAPYVSLFLDPEAFIDSNFYSYLIFLFGSQSTDAFLVLIGLILVFIFFFKTLLVIFINRKIIRFSFQESVNLRSFLMNAYQNIPYEKYLSKNSSQYIYNIQALAWTFSGSILQSFLRLISEGIVLIVILILLFISNPFALSLLLMILGIFAISYDYFYKKKLHDYGVKTNDDLKNMIQSLNEGIHGLKEIRVLGKAKFFFNKVKNNAQGFADASVETYVINLMPRYIFEFIAISFVVLLVSIFIILDQDSALLISTLSMFGIAAIRLIPSTTQIIAAITAMRFGRDSVDILYDDLKDINNIKFSNYYDDLSLKDENFERLSLRNVSFTFDKMEFPAARNISLDIKKGDSVGIIGKSGAGKSTLIDLMLGLLKPDEGEIKFNGELVDDKISNWQSKVAYLPQQVFLTDDTIINNIALGEKSDNIDIDKILLALEKARLKEFVNNLPDGLNTILGENGVRLSGGQRQRISLARAFYYDREVLILDEATSSIDLETEKKIVDEISFLKGKITMIVIAHRLTTVENCDHIYKISKGEIFKL